MFYFRFIVPIFSHLSFFGCYRVSLLRFINIVKFIEKACPYMDFKANYHCVLYGHHTTELSKVFLNSRAEAILLDHLLLPRNFSVDIHEISVLKVPVKLIEWVKITHSSLHVVSELFHSIISACSGSSSHNHKRIF